MLQANPVEGGIAVDMGAPRFGWGEIPLAYAMDTASLPVAWKTSRTRWRSMSATRTWCSSSTTSTGIELERLGPQIEHDPMFPERVNVNVAQVVSRDKILLRVWERGAGLTCACGTGACATAVAAMKKG